MKEMGLMQCTKRPDIDNLTKFILDGLEGIFFKDDSTVVKIMATKAYHLRPPYEGVYSFKIHPLHPSDCPGH